MTCARSDDIVIKRGTMNKKYVFPLIIVLIIFLLSSQPASADIAPPETPPGSNLVPGSESTQVQMLAETVVLAISRDPADPKNTIAATTAAFTMRNMGNVIENMKVRFPLTFSNGNSDGFGEFPEIQGINVKVDGKTVPNHRELQPYLPSEGPSYEEHTDIPWAVFDVAFPPLKDVIIEVSYPVYGYGYYPYEAFQYILETGAGWKGTIGSIDVIARFPYEISGKNVGMEGADYAGYGSPTPGGVISGKEIRWHFEDLEPTRFDNIQILLVAPSLWESVLRETETVTRHPTDGEAWGRLGKAYKEIIRMSKGYLREDPDGLEMFHLSRKAYENCLELLPQDPVWHFGYADLLWSHYYFDIHAARKEDSEGLLPLILSHLRTALTINPKTQQAIDLLTEISYAVPEAVNIEGDEFIFLGLTATPPPPTPWNSPTAVISPTPTNTIVSNAPPEATYQLMPTAGVATQESEPQNTTCGSLVLVLPLIAAGFMLMMRRYT